MTEAQSATVRRVSQETPTLLRVELEVPEALAAAYTVPGQYLALYPEGEVRPVYLAIASAPGAPLELLVGIAAQERLKLAEGAAVRLDPPAGKGFPIEEAKGKELLLFGVGSGASALRAVVEHVRRHRAEFGRVRWFHGARAPEEHAYRALDEAWRADGVEVLRTVSKPWVQDVFRADPSPIGDAIAFLCGTKAMTEGVKAALAEAGLSPERVRFNF